MALESELGTKLLVRTSRSVRLTEAGRIFADHANDMLASLDTAKREIADLEQRFSSLLKVAFLMTTTADWFPEACAAFHKQHPATRVSLASLEAESTVAAVRDGVADLGCTVSLDELISDLESTMLFRDLYGIICPKRHPFARRPAIRIDDLSGASILMPDPATMPGLSRLSERMLASEKSPRFVFDLHDIGSISPFLLTGEGVVFTMSHILNYLYDKDSYAFVPIEDVAMRPKIVACWKKSRETTMLLDFVNALRAACDRCGYEIDSADEQ